MILPSISSVLMRMVIVGKIGFFDVNPTYGFRVCHPASYSFCMNLIRALVPSWRFFDGFGSVPELQYRVKKSKDTEYGPWVRAIPNEPRSLRSLFYNPEGNLRMACLTLVERYATVEDPSTETTTARLIENLVRYRLKKDPLIDQHSGFYFQFRITLNQEEAILSAEYSFL